MNCKLTDISQVFRKTLNNKETMKKRLKTILKLKLNKNLQPSSQMNL